jgi:hypothetical protein
MFEVLASTGAHNKQGVKTHHAKNDQSNQTNRNVQFYYEEGGYHVANYTAWSWIGQGTDGDTSRWRIGK